MDIKSAKELTEILKILTKFGVKSAEINGIKLELAEREKRPYTRKQKTSDKISDELTQYNMDEVLAWSSGGAN